MKSIIEYANQKDIQVLLLTFPAHEAYVRHLNPDQLAQTLAIAQEMDDKFSHVSYINELSDSSFIQTDFFDADHLSYEGAKKFSNKIDKVINQFPDKK